MTYRIALFVPFVFLLSGCWETQCLTGPDEAGRACYDEQLREAERCERRRPNYPNPKEEQPPDYQRDE